MFQNRAITNYAKGRAFALLVEQRWITIALAYIKEMDFIATKRHDAAEGKPEKDASLVATPKTKAPKKYAKGGKEKPAGQPGGGSLRRRSRAEPAQPRVHDHQHLAASAPHCNFNSSQSVCCDGSCSARPFQFPSCTDLFHSMLWRCPSFRCLPT